MANTIKLKRGTDAQRTFTPADGEPLWTSDTKELYVGDGSTVGGIPIGINNLDGGSANSIYLSTQDLDGGGA